MSIWLRTNYRPLIHQLLPVVDRQVLSNIELDFSKDKNFYKGELVGKIYPTLESLEQSDRSLTESSMQYLAAHPIKSRMTVLKKIRSNIKLSEKVQEILFMIRPVVYVFLVKKFRNSGRKEWIPWMVSIVIEIIAHQSWVKRVAEGNPSLMEKQESFRRMLLFFYYLIRNPFYERFTKYNKFNSRSWVDSMTDMENSWKITQIPKRILKVYQELWEKSFFYSSSS